MFVLDVCRCPCLLLVVLLRGVLFRRWLVSVAYCSLVCGCRFSRLCAIIVLCCWLCVACCLLFVVCCCLSLVLVFVCCGCLLGGGCCLLVVFLLSSCLWLVVVCALRLFGVCGSLCIVCCVLFVVVIVDGW